MSAVAQVRNRMTLLCATDALFTTMKQSKTHRLHPKLTLNSPLPAPVLRRNTWSVWDGKSRKYVILGSVDDPASLTTRYTEFLQNWVKATLAPSSGGVNSETGTFNPTCDTAENSALPPANPTPNGTKVVELVLAYLDEKLNHSQYYNFKAACRFLKERYGDMTTAEFEAYHLLQLQGELKMVYAYKHANTLVNIVRQIFKWGEVRRLVPPGKFEHLQTLEPLREGRENEESGEVEDWVLERTLRYLLPVY